MNDNHSPSVSSVDGFIPNGDSTEEMYSLYTGLNLRRKFLTFSLGGKPCCTVSASLLKNVTRVLLTNIVVSVLIIMTVMSVSIGLGLHAVLRVKPQPVIDYSLKAFTVPNHEVTRHQEAFEIAVEDNRNWNRKWMGNGHRSRRSISAKVHRDKRAIRTQYYRRHKVIVIYVAIGGSNHNIFTRERIETIHRIETDVLQMPAFSEFCFKAYSHKVQHCDDALDSLVSTYFYPRSSANNQHADDVRLVDDFEGTVRAVLSSPFGFLYTDGHANRSFFESTFLKSEISFGMPLPGLMSCLLDFWTREGSQSAVTLLLLLGLGLGLLLLFSKNA